VSPEVWLVLAAVLAVGWLAPQVGDGWFQPVEEAAARFATRKTLAIFSMGLAAILTRLALLPVLPVPIPAIHDEFSYLLAADTFAHGRLTNPPHPMSVFFDTFHVLQHPTYASKYPPAPGAVLALGQILGHPWIGSLLSMAGMCMAMTWMLQGWFPAPWALLGGVFVLLQLGLFRHWVDGYFGGAVAALGGALVLGAFPRVVHFRRLRDAILMGMGAALLASSRPVEGLIFCVPIAGALALEFLSKRKWSRAGTVRRVLLPLILVPAAALVFLGYYNWRVTENAFLFPYVLYQREYFSDPVFAWQKPNPPLHYANQQFEVFFNVWHPTRYGRSWNEWERRSWQTCQAWWYVFLGPILSVPFVALPWMLKGRRVRFLLVQFLVCAAGLLSVVWFQPHYAAPLAATLFGLLVQAMRYLRRLEFRGRAVGIFLTRLVVILVLDGVVVLAGHARRYPVVGWNRDRAQLIERLDASPGRHLVLVHYSPEHNVHHEWVYNAADIDRAKIVWAREIPGRDWTTLLDYFKDRKIWMVGADDSPPKLEEYRRPEQLLPGRASRAGGSLNGQ